MALASEQPNRLSTYFFIVILVMYIVLRVAFYQGIVPSDPMGYLLYAKQIAEGEFQLELHHYNTRFAVTVPIAFLFMVFGINEATTIIWPFVCSVITLYLTFRIGTALVGTVAALLACTFLTVLPLDIGLAMQVLPEPIMTAMLCTCVWCFYRGTHETNVFKARLWLVGAGMALWGAYSAKITGIILMPALIGYTILLGRPLRNLGWLFLGLFALLIPEYTYYYAKTDDLLFPFHAIDAAHLSPSFVESMKRHLVGRLFGSYPIMTLVPSTSFGIMFIAIYGGVAYAFLAWRTHLLLLLWFGVLFLYTVFGTTSFREYIPLPSLARYLHPVMIPGLLLLGMSLSKLSFPEIEYGLVKRRNVVYLGRGLIIGIIAVSVVSAAFGLRRNYLDVSAMETKKLGQELSQLGPAVIYADERDRARLTLFMNGADSQVISYPEPDESREVCDYVRRMQPKGLLLYNWRVVNQQRSNWELSAEQRHMLRRLYDERPMKAVWHYWAKPEPWFFALARIGFFKQMLGKAEQEEFLGGAEEMRGIVLYEVDPNLCAEE